jgi:hypothetical protein
MLGFPRCYHWTTRSLIITSLSWVILKDSGCQSSNTFQIPAFREFLAFFVQPDVYEADLLPNYYYVPLRHDDLIHWKENGVQPLGQDGEQPTERAHKRIFDNFCSVLAVLEYSYLQDVAFETWTTYLCQKRFILMPIPPEFYGGPMFLFARHLSHAKAAIQTSFPQLRKSLEEWGLYQPYSRPVLLIPALTDYLSLFREILPSLVNENDAVVSIIAYYFESFVVCFFPRPCLQRLSTTEICFRKAKYAPSPRRS